MMSAGYTGLAPNFPDLSTTVSPDQTNLALPLLACLLGGLAGVQS